MQILNRKRLLAFVGIFLIITGAIFVFSPIEGLAKLGGTEEGGTEFKVPEEVSEEGDEFKYQLMVPIPQPGGREPIATVTSGRGGEGQAGGIAGYINVLYLFGLGIGGILAFGLLVYGGFLWTVSGAAKTSGKAKSVIGNALLGLAILATSYIILHTVNPDLVGPLSVQKKPFDMNLNRTIREKFSKDSDKKMVSNCYSIKNSGNCSSYRLRGKTGKALESWVKACEQDKCDICGEAKNLDELKDFTNEGNCKVEGGAINALECVPKKDELCPEGIDDKTSVENIIADKVFSDDDGSDVGEDCSDDLECDPNFCKIKDESKGTSDCPTMGEMGVCPAGGGKCKMGGCELDKDQIESLSCDDGNPCTIDDYCVPEGAGAKCVGKEKTCDPTWSNCQTGECNEDTGECESKDNCPGTTLGCYCGTEAPIGDSPPGGECVSCIDMLGFRDVDNLKNYNKQCLKSPDDLCQDGNCVEGKLDFADPGAPCTPDDDSVADSCIACDGQGQCNYVLGGKDCNETDCGECTAEGKCKSKCTGENDSCYCQDNSCLDCPDKTCIHELKRSSTDIAFGPYGDYDFRMARVMCRDIDGKNRCKVTTAGSDPKCCDNYPEEKKKDADAGSSYCEKCDHNADSFKNCGEECAKAGDCSGDLDKCKSWKCTNDGKCKKVDASEGESCGDCLICDNNGNCVSKCGDGEVDPDCGEKCDPGKNGSCDLGRCTDYCECRECKCAHTSVNRCYVPGIVSINTNKCADYEELLMENKGSMPKNKVKKYCNKDNCNTSGTGCVATTSSSGDFKCVKQ